MHVVRIHPNGDGGVLFWAEDDRGFNGGADTLGELLAIISEYADDDLDIGEWRAELMAVPQSSGDAKLFEISLSTPSQTPSSGSEFFATSTTRMLEAV
ncbi:MAG: hypothetical protein OXF61_02690 [Acidimicrobiaceae bacterium]|nr:hypothetical protein [Chloroflexota bacterium]MCY3948090.1 hypothetical protein [Acidimicrobiaceae bacterium]